MSMHAYLKNDVKSLTPCMLVLTFSKNSFKNTVNVSNGLDPDKDQHSVPPDLDPHCLQRLSADNTSR